MAADTDLVLDGDEKRIGFLEAFGQPGIRQLAIGRGAARLGMTTVSYGTMVYLATQGSPQWQISIIAAASYTSSVLFGVQGGMLADSLSKRLAIAAGFFTIGVMFLALPIIGIRVGPLLFTMFLASSIMQIVSPSMKAAVALVTAPHDVAVAATSITIASSIASAAGSSFLAPVLIKIAGLNTLLIVSALIMFFGAWQTLRLQTAEQGAKLVDAVRSVPWREQMPSLRNTANWLYHNRGIGALILVGAIAVSLFEAFTTMIPVYVRDVLHSDPTNAVYIFAPAGVGFLVGMLATPALIDMIGARKLAVVSVMLMSFSMVLFGFIDLVDGYVAPLSPMRLVGWILGVEISDRVLAASFVAMPANFGSTAAGSAVQTFINQRVPTSRQGATFGLQEVHENVATLILVLLLGAASGVIGPRAVFVIAPILAFAMMMWLMAYSHRKAGDEEITWQQALHNLLGTNNIHGDH